MATVNDDQALREKNSEAVGRVKICSNFAGKHINCEGCRVDGVKTVFCEHMCEIRKCALRKGVSTCGNCSELETCQTVGAIISNDSAVLKNLRG